MFVTVEFRNRSTIQLASLIDDAPSTAFLGTTHVQVCEILASGMAPESLFKVYVNTLSKKSRKARAISALANLIRASEDPVVSVSSDFIDERFQNLLGKRVELNCSKKEARNSLDKVEIFRFLGKALLHLLFRLFGSLSRLRKFDAVVRAWVDTTDRTYPEQIDSHVLLIFPFSGSVARQLKYVLRCRKKKRRFRLAGIPYRFRDLMKVALDWKGRDRHIVNAEYQGFKRMADSLLKSGVKNVYTTDEFEAASCIMHEHLMKHGVRCENRSHGVATYGPFVNYSLFRCHTQCQADFYRLRGNVDRFEVKKRSSPNRARIHLAKGHYQPVFIYLLGNWRQSGKRFEAKFEPLAIGKLVAIAREVNIPVILKAHPNTNQAELHEISKKFSVKVEQNLPDLGDQHPIFLTLLSSAYFDYMSEGPVRACSSHMLNPALLFGEDVVTFSIEPNDRSLAKFSDARHWIESFETQSRFLDRSLRTTADG